MQIKDVEGSVAISDRLFISLALHFQHHFQLWGQTAHIFWNTSCRDLKVSTTRPGLRGWWQNLWSWSMGSTVSGYNARWPSWTWSQRSTSELGGGCNSPSNSIVDNELRVHRVRMKKCVPLKKPSHRGVWWRSAEQSRSDFACISWRSFPEPFVLFPTISLNLSHDHLRGGHSVEIRNTQKAQNVLKQRRAFQTCLTSAPSKGFKDGGSLFCKPRKLKNSNKHKYKH